MSRTITTEVVRDAVTFPRKRLGEPRDMSSEQFDRWLSEVERAAAEKLEAELEARIEDRDYWYRIATEAKDQRDAALSTIDKVRGIVELLYPGEMTPTAKRHLDRALGSVPSTGEGNE